MTYVDVLETFKVG